MSIIAFDIGASGGKVVAGTFDGSQLRANEIYRFSNDPVWVGNHLHWDVLRLIHELKQGLQKARHLGYDHFRSLAVDTWAVDFGLIDQNGELLANPYHYRDPHTDGVMEEIFQEVTKEEVFSSTGIQFMPINTINQLYAMKKANASALREADTLLLIPDLLRYFLTGEKISEQTNASTTQLFHAVNRRWDDNLISRLGLSRNLFSDIVKSGTQIGHLLPSVRKEINIPSIPVVATAEHDTASAVAAIPTEDQDFAYLSCGTWSLLGTEIDQPVLNEKALDWNFTNEGGVNDTFRLLKNIMGLWLLQECERMWTKEGEQLSYEEMNQLTKQAKPFQSFVDPDDPMFLNPVYMPLKIQEYCRRTNQHIPETKGEISRCILESLAMKYRLILERTEQLSSKRFKGLHMVGGGIQNEILCQFTANAIKRPVWAGPTEATSIGNLMIQYVTLGEMNDIHEGRKVIKNSFPVVTYVPNEISLWDERFRSFREVTGC